MGDFLLYSQSGAVVTITMNQPQTRNRLTGNSAIDELVAMCARVSRDPEVRVVILTAADPAFCAGGDINVMREQFRDRSLPGVVSDQYRLGIQRIPLAFHSLEVPLIAAVNGPAVGAGCDLACMCDIRIASERASFAESFIKLGIVPGDGGAWFLQRIVGTSRAAQMSYTGETVNAADALAYGLVSKVVAHDRLMEEAQVLAQAIAANPGPALRMTKRLLRQSEHSRLEDVLQLSAAFQALAHHTPEHERLVNAFLGKQSPRTSS